MEPEGIHYEADPRHCEIFLKQIGLNDKTKAVAAPGYKTTGRWMDGDVLPASGQRDYRSACMRLAYLGSDRPELQYATKEACRSMAKPTRGSWKLVKRMARYLKGAPRLVQKFGFQEMPEAVVVTGDSDYAGCRQTRKSTSGLVIMYGDHALRIASRKR